MPVQVYGSAAAHHIKWVLTGPLSTSIFVLEDDKLRNGPNEAYFRQTLAGVSWHPISEESVSETPQSRILVKVSEVEEFEDRWEEYHEHADPDDDGCTFAEDDGDGPGELLECCNEKRPVALKPIVVTATNRDFVTIHDYVTTVHAWLMENYALISAVVNVWDNGNAPPGQKIYAKINDVENLTIMDNLMWDATAEIRAPAPYTGPRSSEAGEVLAMRMPPDMVRQLNAQLRAEGSDIQYDEYDE